MIDLKKPIDLQNIKIEDFLATILAKKSLLISAIVVVLGVLVAYLLVNDFMQTKTRNSQQVAEIQNKIGVIASYQATKQQFDVFQQAIPKGVDEDAFVGALSDIAVSNNVEAKSFTSVNVTANDYYDVATVGVVLRVKAIKDLVNFMQAVEKASVAYRIEGYTIGAVSVDGFEVNMNISTIKTKMKT